MNHKGTARLETERLALRRFTLDDAEAMFNNWASDPEVTKFMTWPPHKSIKVTRFVLGDWIASYERPDYYQWAIEVKEHRTLIGSIAVVKGEDTIEKVEIGYCIGRAWWHKGYTSEALAELVRFFFDEVGVNRIESTHDPRNPNSGKVMLKCGLIYEGTLRQSARNNSGLCDASYYALLADNWRI